MNAHTHARTHTDSHTHARTQTRTRTHAHTLNKTVHSVLAVVEELPKYK